MRHRVLKYRLLGHIRDCKHSLLILAGDERHRIAEWLSVCVLCREIGSNFLFVHAINLVF